MSHCHDCPHGSATVTRAYCCADKARERDKYERMQEVRTHEAVQLTVQPFAIRADHAQPDPGDVDLVDCGPARLAPEVRKPDLTDMDIAFGVERAA